MKDPYCDHLASPEPWALGLSIFLVVGILVSYLPQHIKIVQNGTSAGLSPWWVLLGTLSSIAAITNIVVLPTSQHDMKCCREISGAACGAALLGVIQVGVQWTCFMLIMILFLAFFPRASDRRQQAHQPHDFPLPKPRDAVIVGSSALFALLFASVGSLAVLVSAPSRLLGWANFLGVCAGAMSCVQYVPQIWTTYKSQKLLSLSITTMLFQVPGSFLFSFSLFLRVGWQGWSSWVVYCITGVFQGCLLGMAISFWMRDRRAAVALPDQPHDEEQAASENDPLLPPAVGSVRRPIKSSTLRTLNGNKKNPIGLLYSATPPDDSSLPSDTESDQGSSQRHR